MMRFVQKEWGRWLATAVSLFAYSGMVWMQIQYGTLSFEYVVQTIVWFLLAFAAFVGAIIWAEKRPFSLRWMWVTAVLFRVLLLFTTPTLSDDVYRYLWDGYVANEGVSPYAFAIDAPELDYLDIPQRILANNSWMASPYMPVAQWVFWGTAFLFPLQPIFLQMVMIIFDLLTAWMLAKLLTLAALPAHHLLLWLWNPLVVVEVAHGAHVDVWMVLLTVTAVYLTLAPKHAHRTTGKLGAPIFLALATLTKILPILISPILFWRWTWRQLVLYGAVVFALLIPSGWRAGWGLTGDLDGTGLFGALRIYSSQWNFNSGIFHWLEMGLMQTSLAQPTSVAKAISLGLILIVLLIVWVLARRFTDVRATLRLTAVPLMAYLLLTPTVHPWYTLILLAFVPFLAPAKSEPRWPWWTVTPWLYLSGALIFSYITYYDPMNFSEYEWVHLLEWLPIILMIFLLPVVYLHKRSAIRI